MDSVVDQALAMVRNGGYESLTMRRLAAALGVVPGALYVHVRDRSTLADLMIARLCTRIVLPEPDPSRWREQIIDLCTQLRDQYLSHPGLPRAALTAAPRSLETLKVNEVAIAVLLGGAVPLRTAAWAVDAAFLYVNAYSTVHARRADSASEDDEPGAGRRAVLDRLASLPPDEFPVSARNAEVLVSGDGHERFGFTLGLLFDSLTPDRTIGGPQRS